MIYSVGIDLHQGSHRARCLDDRAQLCDGFTFQTTPEGLATLEERAFREWRQSHYSPGASWFTLADGSRPLTIPASQLPTSEGQDAESSGFAAISAWTGQE